MSEERDVCAVAHCDGESAIEFPTIVDPVHLCVHHAQELGIRVLPRQRQGQRRVTERT